MCSNSLFWPSYMLRKFDKTKKQPDFGDFLFRLITVPEARGASFYRGSSNDRKPSVKKNELLVHS